jgi:hypothetical protein
LGLDEGRLLEIDFILLGEFVFLHGTTRSIVTLIHKAPLKKIQIKNPSIL